MLAHSSEEGSASATRGADSFGNLAIHSTSCGYLSHGQNTSSSRHLASSFHSRSHWQLTAFPLAPWDPVLLLPTPHALSSLAGLRSPRSSTLSGHVGLQHQVLVPTTPLTWFLPIGPRSSLLLSPTHRQIFVSLEHSATPEPCHYSFPLLRPFLSRFISTPIRDECKHSGWGKTAKKTPKQLLYTLSKRVYVSLRQTSILVIIKIAAKRAKVATSS